MTEGSPRYWWLSFVDRAADGDDSVARAERSRPGTADAARPTPTRGPPTARAATPASRLSDHQE
jgi:hypothetical protein